ncbi:hypothetical protein Tco_1252606 [Tanacetum coccineum]
MLMLGLFDAQIYPESAQSENNLSDNIPKQDEGHVSDLETLITAHIPNCEKERRSSAKAEIRRSNLSTDQRHPLMTPGTVSSGLYAKLKFFSQHHNVPPPKERLRDPVVTICINRPVLHEMTSDQICSDLTPNRQETSVDNISSDLNIKEAMADSAWIEAMRDDLHQFDRLNVWELVDKPFGKMVIKLKWLWKNKKDEDHCRLVKQFSGFMLPCSTQVFSNLSNGRERWLFHLENPPSSSRTLSSMKNLEDNFTFGDQVINDKSQEDELGKTTVESEVESMVIVPIQQASSSAPPLNTPVIDLSSPKPVSPSFMAPVQISSGPAPALMTPGYISSGLMQNSVSPTLYIPPSKKDYEILLQQVFNEYFNPPPRAVSPDPVAIVASRAVDPVGSPSSTTIDQDEHLLVLHQQIKKFNLKSLIKLTKNHSLDNVIGDPSRPISTRSQLQEHAIWCYFDANDNLNPFGRKRSGWDLLSQRKMTSEQLSSGLRLHQMTSEQLGSGLKLHQLTSEQLGSGLRLHQMAYVQFCA